MRHRGLIWGLAISLLILGGCGIKPEEPPVVFEKMMQTMSKVEQLEFTGNFQIVGTSTLSLLQGLQDLEITGSGRVNLAKASDFRYLLNLVVSGKSSDGKTEIGAEIRSFPDCNYFKITQIVLPMSLPFSLSADNRWYQIKSGGQNREWLGSSQPLDDVQLQQVRALLSQSKLFNVVQKFPDETVGGGRTYHWQVAVDAEAMRGLLRDWVNLTNPTGSVDIDHWAAMLSDYTYEFWINKYDHRLMKASVKGWYDSSEHQRVDFAATVSFTKFNAIQSIERPTSVQEFDLRQMLGLPNSTQ